ncbi:hypothetical protein N7490_003582 [Penicillium lividum]|nr:hypothetical protein N7490_003582 [Penicillium lividum]
MSAPFGEEAATAARGFRASAEDEELVAEYSMIADEYPEEIDYYALLGLSPNPPPTEADIRSAYRNLSLSFHPDKQPPHLRDAARRHFTQIQEAYDALVNPQKRVVYDMLGAEGVKREWGIYGSMGRGGKAESQDVGVKAMAPEEFRRWFLDAMKKRERKAVQSLVASKGTIVLGINASDTIRVDREMEEVSIHIPSPRLTSFGATYQFKTPLPIPGFLAPDEGNNEEEDQSTEADLTEEEDFGEVIFNAAVTGGMARPKVPYHFELDGTEHELELPGPRLLVAQAQAIHLGATIAPNFRNLANSSVTIEGILLPESALKTTISRKFQPMPGITPFQVTASNTIKHSMLETPPVFDIQVIKPITKRKMVFCSWSSGSWEWPEFLFERFMFLGPSPETLLATEGDLSHFQVGLISVPERKARSSEENDDDDEELANLQQKAAAHRAAESWETYLNVSPQGGAIVAKYSRNVFSGKPADDPVRSEWSGEGYTAMPRMEEARAVRLEITNVIGLDLTPSWTVKGTRRVGEYTTVGLGVGIAQTGVHMTFSWSRLGQGFNIPVILCPASEANQDAAVFATLVPWLAYCVVEFGYIRPRDRKNRRQAAARRHNELKKLLPKKRAESLEAIELMTDQVQRRQDREAKKDGLVITKAEYGYVASENKKLLAKFPESRLIDVTIPVAALVDEGQLNIPGKTVKFHLMGFYDPAPLLPKRLRVWYTFQGSDHFVDVGDKEAISCPMRAHLVSA